MRQNLHPDTIFHITDRPSLAAILDNMAFRPSYSREKLSAGDTSKEFGVPCVCFCDIRVSELKYHMLDYGGYGIGMAKTWAERKGCNPVVYLTSTSAFSIGYMDAIDDLYAKASASPETYSKLMELLRYAKNYEAPLYRKGDLANPSFRFGDEREWRYVPTDPRVERHFLPKSAIESKDDKLRWNKQISDLTLKFEASDINYVLVKSEFDRIEVASILNTKAVSPASIPILTVSQIERDF